MVETIIGTTKDLDKAASIIRDGGLVAFPTETVYGLGGNALNKESSKKIYEAKGRPSDNPLIVHVSDISEVAPLVKNIPDKAKKLMDAFWPGPMTLVFEKSNIVPDETTGGLDSVAIRLPANTVARELIKKSGVPIAAPSANQSGRPSPTTSSHVICDMNGKIDMIIDGGSSTVGLESTIIDVTKDRPLVLRPGFISLEDIIETIGDAGYDPAILKKPDKNYKPKAPGMKYRHYAPKAPLRIIKGSDEAVTKKILSLSEEAKLQGKKLAIICQEERRKIYEDDAVVVISIGRGNDYEEIARNLFGVLRKCDEVGADEIVSECFYGGGLGDAIMNRLIKAAGYNVVEAGD